MGAFWQECEVDPRQRIASWFLSAADEEEDDDDEWRMKNEGKWIDLSQPAKEWKRWDLSLSHSLTLSPSLSLSPSWDMSWDQNGKEWNWRKNAGSNKKKLSALSFWLWSLTISVSLCFSSSFFSLLSSELGFDLVIWCENDLPGHTQKEFLSVPSLSLSYYSSLCYTCSLSCFSSCAHFLDTHTHYSIQFF